MFDQPRYLSEAELETLLAHREWVQRLARGLIADVHRADDVAQASWLSVLRNPPRHASNLRSWLSKLVRNTARSMHRTDSRRDHHERETQRTRELEAAHADAALERAELAHELSAIVMSLREPYKTAIVLTYFEGLPTNEIAERLGVSPSSVRSQVQRGLALLKAELERKRAREDWLPALLVLAKKPAIPVATGGAVLMSLKLKVALVVIAVAGIGLWLWSARETAPPALNIAESKGAVAGAPIDVAGANAKPEPNALEEQSALDSRVAVATPPRATPTDCIIFGRAVDDRGLPIVGADVKLFAYPRWNESNDFPVTDGSSTRQGFATLTDRDGRFRVVAPMPTTNVIYFRLTADDFHDRVRLRYGGGDRRDPEPLHAGENDLGTFKLATTGVLIGSVHDRRGVPIVGATVNTGSERSLTDGTEAKTDEFGRYRIAHVPVGSRGVKAKATGYLSAFQKPFEITRASTTRGPDFELADAPAIRGRIVDEAGRPLANAKLWGWPESEGAGAGTTSDAEGKFVLSLPQDEPYTLEVTLDGYEPYHVNDRKTHYKPGAENVECVLKKDISTTFVIVDAVSGEPITRFDMQVIRNQGRAAIAPDYSMTEWTPQFREHVGGVVTLGARPGIDLFEVAAPNHARASDEVVHESSTSARQVIRLDPGATLLARVMSKGAPLVGATVNVEHGFMQQDPRVDPAVARPKFIVHPSEAHLATTDEEGRVRMLGFDPGEYRVTVRDVVGAPLVISPVSLGRNQVRDLGELELRAGGSIHGRLIVEAGRSPAGLRVMLDAEDASGTSSDIEGNFVFENVPVGDHEVSVDEVSGILASGPPFAVTVASGETKDVALDLTDRGVCSISVRVLVAGKPVSKATVYCETLQDAPPQEAGLDGNARAKRERRANGARLGKTDESGWVHGSMRAAGKSRLRVDSADGLPLGFDPVVIEATSGAKLEHTVDLTTGSLELEWSSNYTVEKGSTISLKVTSSEASARVWWASSRVIEPTDSTSSTSNRCNVSALAPGEYDIEILVPNARAAARSSEPIRFVGHVRFVANEVARVQLIEARAK